MIKSCFQIQSTIAVAVLDILYRHDDMQRNIMYFCQSLKGGKTSPDALHQETPSLVKVASHSWLKSTQGTKTIMYGFNSLIGSGARLWESYEPAEKCEWQKSTAIVSRRKKEGWVSGCGVINRWCLLCQFQLSYSKSWKMMLSKCCTQYASKFGKLGSGHRTGKGQFSFQSQRKAKPKNAQTTAQLHSSHTLVK